jgi:hypothetical protein
VAKSALYRCDRDFVLVVDVVPVHKRADRTDDSERAPADAGEPVELSLRSNDVIHSFWVPNLAGKTDMIPGRVTRMVIQADRPGIYRGQCAEYCGLQHSLMAFDVLVLSRPEFDTWLARLAQPVREPSHTRASTGAGFIREYRLRRMPHGARRRREPARRDGSKQERAPTWITTKRLFGRLP